MLTRKEKQLLVLREPEKVSGFDTQHLQNGEHEGGGGGGGGNHHRQSSFSPELVQKKRGQVKNGQVHSALQKAGTNLIAKSVYKPVKKYSEDDFERTNTIQDREKNILEKGQGDLRKLWASLSICWGSNAQVKGSVSSFETQFSLDFFCSRCSTRKSSRTQRQPTMLQYFGGTSLTERYR